MRKLSSSELETIIIFNQEDKMADIFTYSKVWQKHLENKLGLKPFLVNDSGGKEYLIDKKRIKPPRVPKVLSPAHRKKLAESLRRRRIISSKSSVVS